MEWPETRFESWQDLNREVLEKHLAVTPSLMRSYIYRGQADASWSLQPSLARLLKLLQVDRVRAIAVEKRVLTRFQTRAHLYLPPHLIPEVGSLDWWTLMQHYRAPTRVLDWTHSPLVGLYFAVNERWDVDGAVWTFHRRTLGDRADEKFGRIPDGSWLLDEDKFWRADEPPPRVIAFDRARLTERMVAQQGAFTVCQDILLDHADAIADVLPAYEPVRPGEVSVFRHKFIIPAAKKREFLKRLHHMNVTADALFPGIDGLGREIEEQVRLV